MVTSLGKFYCFWWWWWSSTYWRRGDWVWCRYILKKIAKILIIAVGDIALLLGCLEYQKWIAVNWSVVEDQTSTIMTQAAHKAYVVTQQMGHEIPTIGLGVIGFLPGLALGFAKG